MQTISLTPPLGCDALDRPPCFNIVMAYEDFATGQRALGVYRRLVTELGHECLFNSHMWKFNFMKFPKLREMAAEEATYADMIIISVHGNAELPSEVKVWCERSLQQNETCPSALVLLFDPGSQTHTRGLEIRNYLESLAAEMRMDFFCNPDHVEKEPSRLSADSFFSAKPGNREPSFGRF